MSFWNQNVTIDYLNSINKDSMAGHLGIEIIEIGYDFLKATMPLDARTMQPMGLLHGGASVVLSETLGSIASFCVIDDAKNKSIVGLEINANHLKSVKKGFVTGITKPIKIGRRIHLWQTDIYDQDNNLICTSKLTVMVSDLLT